MHLQLLSHAEQVAAHLKQEILGGRWKEKIPGSAHLQAELGVNRVTINAALRLLESQGVLADQGPRKRRRIVLTSGMSQSSSLRIRILLYEKEDRAQPHHLGLAGELQQAGHAVNFASKSLHDLGMKVERVARFVNKTPADAWIVVAGSREVLEWLANQSVPALALFGRFSGLPIAAASPRKLPAMILAVRRLVALGHHRIVMLTRPDRIKPWPALFEQAFLDELTALGVSTGSYNLPEWEDSPEGFQTGMESLFRYSPPTAVILGDSLLFHATQQFLAQRGITAPGKISLLSLDPSPGFKWCRPDISHIRWDHVPLLRRVIRWVKHVAEGKEDHRQTLFDAEWVEGGTIGPVPTGRELAGSAGLR